MHRQMVAVMGSRHAAPYHTMDVLPSQPHLAKALALAGLFPDVFDLVA